MHQPVASAVLRSIRFLIAVAKGIISSQRLVALSASKLSLYVWKYPQFFTLRHYTTNFQSQLFSVGFVVSGLSPGHAGGVADLPVLRDPRRPDLTPLKPVISIPFHSLLSKNSTEQYKTGTGKKPYLSSTCACVATTSFSNELLPKSITGTRR